MTPCPRCGVLLRSPASLGGHFAARHSGPDLPAASGGMGSWVEHGACKGRTHLFFPETEVGRNSAAAKAICATCPVIEQCRRWALDTGEPHGVWGGLTPHERRKIRWPSKAAPRRRP